MKKLLTTLFELNDDQTLVSPTRPRIQYEKTISDEDHERFEVVTISVADKTIYNNGFYDWVPKSVKKQLRKALKKDVQVATNKLLDDISYKGEKDEA